MAIQERERALDLIRILAAFCVVVNHAIESSYSFSFNGMNVLSFKSRVLAFSSFTFGRIGVTLFLLLTGYLLLSRAYDEQKLKRFYKHNLLPLLIVWEVWIIIYEIAYCLINNAKFDFGLYIQRALFLRKGLFPHSWYMPMIIGMYLFLPLVAMVINKIKVKYILILLGIGYAYIFISNAVGLYQNAIGVPAVSNQLNLSFGGGTYGVYLLTGYLLARYKDKVCSFMKKPQTIIGAIVIGLAAYVGTVAFQLSLLNKGYGYAVWYDFPGLPIIGLCIFLVLWQINIGGVAGKIITHVSSCSFGIYLIHEIFLNIIRLNTANITDQSTKFLIFAFGTYVVSYAAVALISLIPKAGIIFIKK